MDIISENNNSFSSEISFDFLYSGKAIYESGHSFGPYIRDHFLLVYVEKGDATLYADDASYPLKEHTLIVFFPNSKILYKDEKNSTWRLWWVGLSGDNMYTFFQSLGITPRKPFIEVPDPALALDCLSRLYEANKEVHLKQKLLSMANLYTLFASLVAKSTVSKSTEGQELVQYIRYHYDTIKNINSLVKVFNMSRNTILRIFKKETGLSPMEFLENVRLERACDIITKTEYSISSIAFSLGFNDPLYFSRFFKKRTGLSPSQYRKIKGQKN